MTRVLIDQYQDGSAEYLHFDHDGNVTGMQWVGDAEAVVESNKAAQSEGNKGYGETREWQHIARIEPMALMEYLHKRGIPPTYHLSSKEETEIIMQMIKDPDYRYLRRDI